MNTKVTFRRVLAYILDMFIIVLISSMFASIDKLNPNYEKYNKVYDDYIKYTLNISNSEDLLKDNTINDFSYDLAYYGLSTSIITLVVTFIYFGLFQYYNDGKTIGKALWKIEVKTTDNKKVKLPTMLIRSGLINSIFTSFLLIVSILLLKRNMYDKVSLVIQFIDMGIILGTIATMLFREDRRGLHDIICKTQVQQISNGLDEEIIKEATIVEETLKKEKKTTAKKPTTKKKTSKKVEK